MQINSALRNFKNCAEDAPHGTYEDVKSLNEIIGSAVDSLMHNLREAGYKGNNCDGAFALESEIYQYVKSSNPGHTIFPLAEGFGASMQGEERARVLAQASLDRDFFCNVGIATL